LETHVQGGGSSSRAVGLGRKVFEGGLNVNEKGRTRQENAHPAASQPSNFRKPYLRQSADVFPM
jgi:hypothetical protein